MTGFASTKDLADKTISFEELGPGLYGYTAEGDPNSGVVIGDDSVLVVDAQATPAMAKEVIARIRTITDKPVKHIVLSHYHAVRVLGASGYEGAEIIASDTTRALIVERGQQDMDSEIGRFPRLFRGKESIPGLDLASRHFRKEDDALDGQTRGADHPYRAFAYRRRHGGVAAEGARALCRRHGRVRRDALLRGRAFRRLAGRPGRNPLAQTQRLVPGRGRSLMNVDEVEEGLSGTAAFTSDLFAIAKRAVASGLDLGQTYQEAISQMRPKYGHWVIFEHCMPFDVARAYDEAKGVDWPQIWTAERDLAMWRALEGDKQMKSAEVHS